MIVTNTVYNISFCRYEEVCKPGYPFDGSQSSKTGHFTQVVWKESTELGVGRAVGKIKQGYFCTFIVARYRPAGNYRGKYKGNVKKGKFTKEQCDKIDDIVKAAAEGGECNKLMFPAFVSVRMRTRKN